MKCSEIATFLQKELIGHDIEIYSYSSMSNLEEGTVVFAKKYKMDYGAVLNRAKSVLAIVCDGYKGKLQIPYIISDNPRLDYLRIVKEFFAGKEFSAGICPSATVEEGAFIGESVTIGAHCYIGREVSIGKNTTILSNTSIYGRVKIGSDCYIKPGVVIGGPGFGFEYDENGVPVHFPHTGEVIIGDNVYIGANTTIDRATIDATIIGDHVKIDNQVHIAHNCKIGANTLVTAGVVLCGGVEIGENSWLAPNCTVHQQVKIGKKCIVGMGAVVLKNVKEGRTVFGNPAVRIEET